MNAIKIYLCLTFAVCLFTTDVTSEIHTIKLLSNVQRLMKDSGSGLETCDSCDENAQCTENSGESEETSIVCTCNTGFTGDGFTCTPLETCESNPCTENEICEDNEESGIFTCSCKEDFYWDGTKCTQDENMCEINPNYCADPGAYCVYTGGKNTCPCKPQFTKASETDFCEKALHFGGELFLASPENEMLKPRATTDKESVEALLIQVYNDTEGFISTRVGEPNSNVWPYELFYNLYSEVNDSYISQCFETFLDNAENCTDVCEVYGLSLLKEQTVASAGTISTAICETNGEYCDKSSTKCTAVDGFVTCECRQDYTLQPGNDRYCQAILCASDADCSSPFGTCDKTANYNVGECWCRFGFSGENCQNLWLFIFLVVMIAFALFALIGVIICIATRKKNPKSKSDKSYKTTAINEVYDNHDYGYSQISSKQGFTKSMRASVPEHINTNVYETNVF